MEKIIRSRLFQKTFLAIVIIFTCITAIAAVFFSVTLYTNVLSEYRSKGTAIAKSITDSSVELIINANPETLQSIVDQYLEISGVAYVLVRNANGEIISHTFIPEIPLELRQDPILEKSKSLESLQITSLRIPGHGPVIHITSPIISGLVGYVHIGMETRSILVLVRSVLIKLFVIIAVVFLVSIGIMWTIIMKIAAPLNQVTQYTRRLSVHDFESHSPDYEDLERLSTSSKDEIGSLAKAFTHLENQLIHYIQNLKETISAKEKIEKELAIARDIQKGILPKPLEKTKMAFELDAFVQTSKEVGGDLYDYIVKEEKEKVYVIVGDVSGKGVPAALFMAMTTTLLRSRIAEEESLPEILRKVNALLCANNDNCMFVTLFLGEMDVKSGELVYCLAGHPSPFIVRSDGHLAELPITQGIALGIDPDGVYATHTLTLNSSETLFLFTDGMTDMKSPNDEFYSVTNLRHFLQKNAGKAPMALLGCLKEEIEQYTQGNPLYDDITVMAVHSSVPDNTPT